MRTQMKRVIEFMMIVTDWDVAGVVTWPTDLPGAIIDRSTRSFFHKFLRASSAAEALKELSLVKPDDSFTDGSLSLRGHRALTTSLWQVMILARPQRNYTGICMLHSRKACVS